MGWIPFAIALAAKAGSSYVKGRAKSKQAKRDRKAQVSALNISQKQREDQRRARLAIANSLLNGVPATTGGGVRTNVGLDPALFDQLNKERTYDFSSAVPEQGGAGSEFLAGLLGGVADTIPYGTGNPNDPNRIVSPPGMPTSGGPPVGAQGATGTGAAGDTTVNLDDLMKLLGLDYSPGPGSPAGE